MKVSPLTLVLLLSSLSVDGLAQLEPSPHEVENVPLRLADEVRADDTRVYIVQLASPSAAERQAALAMPRMKFDKTSASTKAWVADIEAEQERVLATAGPA